jgi:hypothetical protein
MHCTYVDSETSVCSAPGATSVRLRVVVAESIVSGRTGWSATMRQKVLCPEHRAKGIAEGWVTPPF